MANVLNLALKKDVFEGIMAQTTNEIPIKKNDWWKKRLMDLDTGRFKYFDVASVSSGSSDKFEYVIDHIEDRGKNYVVVVVLPETSEPEEDEQKDVNVDQEETVDLGDSDSDFEGEVIEPEVIEPEVLEPVTVNPVVVDTVGNVTTARTKGLYLSPEVRKAIVERFTAKFNVEMKKADEYDMKEETIKIINAFCDNKDVFVVNMPFVTIRNTGQIIGYHGGRRLIADRDSDVRIDYKKYELTKYDYVSGPEFTTMVEKFLNNLLSGNYVFINRKYCGFDTAVTGELVLKIAVAARKKYLFRK
jgi:hypothetical protein